MTATRFAAIAPADTYVAATTTAAPCPICGWTPKRPARGGPPVHIAVVLDDIVHGLGRCPHVSRDDAIAQGGRR